MYQTQGMREDVVCSWGCKHTDQHRVPQEYLKIAFVLQDTRHLHQQCNAFLTSHSFLPFPHNSSLNTPDYHVTSHMTSGSEERRRLLT